MIGSIVRKIRVNGKELTIIGNYKSLDDKKIYRIKFGIDISGRDIHIGHLLCLMVVRKIASGIKGNVEILIILGDYTVNMVRNIKRSNINEYSVNIRKLVNQVLFSKNWKVMFFENSTWFTSFEIKGIFKEKLKNLIKSKKDKKMVGQLIYPYFQNYDNTVLRPDIEIGGMDQIYNFSLYNKSVGVKKMIFILVPLIKTIGDEKMSKSSNNCIYIYSDYRDMFWNIIRFNDISIGEYIQVFSSFSRFKGIRFNRRLDINVSNKINLFILLSIIVFKKENINYVSLFLKGKLKQERLIRVKRENVYSLRLTLKSLGIIRYMSDLKQLIKKGLIMVNSKIINKYDDIKRKDINLIKVGRKTKILII
ncbi:hypothetical protein JSR06_00080 [Candidatus Vidania fulgoroideae]|uniref:Tyrosine--tRNA ligase n=1 Tax=Candidatus Vidania fulgoroideorum TaxID=881286 RepID=A0A974X7H3_9PROT|nr:hypothetical protein JSR06_00080 [Candidatus Vidania fulgoroideae]